MIPPWKPSARKDDAEEHRALDDAEEGQEDVLRDDVVEERQVHHPLAQVDRALGDDLARRVGRAEPDAATTTKNIAAVWSGVGCISFKRLAVLDVWALRAAISLERAEAPEGHRSLLPAEDERRA